MTNKDKLIELENRFNEFDKAIEELWGLYDSFSPAPKQALINKRIEELLDLYDSFSPEDKQALANRYLHTNNP